MEAVTYTREEQAENRRKLVDALRSGDYLQGEGALKVFDFDEDTYKFCCLGVACDLYAAETHDGDWEGDEFVAVADGWDEQDRSTTVLPQKVQEWLGFIDESASLTPDARGEYSVDDRAGASSVNSLVALNDGGWSFLEIAKAIEDGDARTL